MKRMALLIVAVVGIALPSHAQVTGKLDLSPDFYAVALRELHDGMWLGGAQKQFLRLIRLSDKAELAHMSLFWASRPEGHDTAYGPSIGAPIGPALGAITAAVSEHVALVEQALSNTPPWVGKIGEWTTVDAYVGYRPQVSPDSHHLIYGIGGQVKIPISALPGWISKAQGGGL